MFNKIMTLLLVIGLISACGSENTSSTNDQTDNTENSEQTVNQFGEQINQDGSISYGDLLQKLTESDSVDAKVAGTVDAVCQAKGCWMTIASDDSETEMRVKFKDYGFFVPKDIAGRKVVFEGKAYREVTSVDELRHYAEDAGKSKEEIEAITEPEESYNFLASGVLLLDKEEN